MSPRSVHSAAALSLFVPLIVCGVARSQVLTGRFFPEKQVYLVGEPVFINFEISNPGDHTAWIDSSMGRPCIERDPIEVVGAKYHGFGSDLSLGCFGGVAGSCTANDIELKPGGKYTGRIFLSALFHMDHAGIYDVRARRHVPVSTIGPLSPPNSSFMDFASDLSVELVHGGEEELKATFQPYIRDVNSRDESAQWQAIWAIEEMAPAFLEDLILKLADMPNRAAGTFGALRRLGTTNSKRKLAGLAALGPDEIRQGAIIELAKTGDRTYLPVLIHIAQGSLNGTRDLAIRSVGLLGGDEAIPFLSSVLREPGVYGRVAAVRGLSITASRSAVTILIELLRDPDESIFREVTQGLAQLTHRSITPEPWGETPSADEYRRWHDWWLLNGLTAPIYSTDSCAQPRPLK